MEVNKDEANQNSDGEFSPAASGLSHVAVAHSPNSFHSHAAVAEIVRTLLEDAINRMEEK